MFGCLVDSQVDQVNINYVPYYGVLFLSFFHGIFLYRFLQLVVMVAVRKLMEKFFTVTDLKYLDDPMPDFHLRKKEDLKRRQSEVIL